MAKKPQSSELNPGPGFRVRRTITRPDKKLLEQFKEFPAPDISDMMNRLYTMDAGIKNLVNEQAIVGPALTVKVFPGDNLMVHKALDLLQPGDIIVIDGGSSPMNGIVGDLIAAKAQHRGAIGFVIDGLMRDLPEVQEVNLPIYARGTTPIGPLHRGPGEVNFPISCGGIVINPGDILCADGDGVTVVRQDFAAEILEKLISKRDSMAEYVAGVRRGVFSNEWVDELLESHDCIFLD
jgi:RraA family protein